MLITIVLSAVILLTLLYRGKGHAAWVLGLATLLIGWRIAGVDSYWLWWLLLTAGVALAVATGYRPLRVRLISSWAMPLVERALPRLGETERVALEAGTVWWDGELFSGRPDWQSLLDFRVQPLSAAEAEFLAGPVDSLCRMVDDWQISQQRDLPPEVWDFLREHGFFGMIIPQEYGGKGFSAIAHSRVVTRLSSRSITLAVTVMVPNSLGPAELLLHYGTEDQKRRYLPRLASGEEIPCFALTGPEAGSDAAATQSTGIVCRIRRDGKDELAIRLNWQKRYITLAPVATLIGLAFRLLDPDRLLGGEEDLGITCALVPADTRGIRIGRRHDPMGVPFQNGPIEGHDVVVPLDTIIGGVDGAGRGWKMLMESLAAGRSISLPAMSVGAAQLATRVVGAYATIREQFDTPIGRFEGVEEPMARIGAYTYLMTAARTLTCGALDAGHRPAVISAIVKAYLTDGMRDCLTDAMDIRAGAGIMRGPRNVLSRAYQAVPIGITVEGSNILTRSMIIYGQGAIRCHPFIQLEIEAAAAGDVERFDQALFGHLNLVARNATRAWVLGLTGGRLAGGHVNRHVAPHFRQLSRMSSAFAVASDVAMLTLGGRLKRREKISGRLADCLAWLYLASATLKAYADDWQRDDDLPMVHWACRHAVFQIQTALDGICQNLGGFAGRMLRWLVLPLGPRLRPPDDRIGSAVARALLDDRSERERLTADIFVPPADEPGLGAMEAALDRAVDAIAVEKRLRDAVRAGRLDKAPGPELAAMAEQQGIISPAELQILLQADRCRDEVIKVDSFTPRQYARLRG